MKVQDVISAMEAIAPTRLAEEWDNVGLLLGGHDWPAGNILLTIDLTDAVLKEAITLKAEAVIAYHPPIFQPLRRLDEAVPKERMILQAARSGIAIYSPHTALDAAPDGVNDWLAAGLGSGDVRALQPDDHLPASEQCKLVTFCPPEATDRLREALAAVGAGRIGEYQQCSFAIPGTGTFFAGETAQPSVGGRNRLERVIEVRFEMVCSQAALALAVTTIRQFHPYEEPPIEIHQLQPRPERTAGQGRRVVLDQAVSFTTLCQRIKTRLGVERVAAAKAGGGQRRFQTIGLCAGAGGSLLDTAINDGCEVFVTGELRHHAVLDATARGCAVVLPGHTNTERGYLRVLRRRLREALPDAVISISKKDRDPLRGV